MNRAFTLIELLCVISIIASLVAIVYPVFFQVKRLSYREVCASNLRQLGQACELYMGDYDDHYPYGINALERIAPHFPLGRAKGDDPYEYPLLVDALKSVQPNIGGVLRCPVDAGRWFLGDDVTVAPLYPNNDGTSYIFADLLTGQTSSFWTDPASAVWGCDASGQWHLKTPQKFGYGLVNVLAYDWHVSARRDAQKLRQYPSWTP